MRKIVLVLLPALVATTSVVPRAKNDCDGIPCDIFNMGKCLYNVYQGAGPCKPCASFYKGEYLWTQCKQLCDIVGSEFSEACVVSQLDLSTNYAQFTRTDLPRLVRV